MNYVNEQNMREILNGIAKKIGQGGTGNGLEDWQAEKEYTENDICVYEGQIYRAKVGFTSDTTFSTTQILEEYTPVGGETIVPYEKDTEINTDDIVSYDNNTYKALYNFVCGEEFNLYALQEYVPQELTEVQEAEIINHFMPNIYSGGNMSVEDSTPIGTIISFMGTIAPENYLVCNGTIYNIADYIELAEFIKTQFGSYNYFGGDGTTTFAVPNMTSTNSDVLYCIKYKMSITNVEEIKDLTTEDMKQIIDAYNPVFEEAKGIEYSTEERRIGTWIDGKPLYQRTYEVTSPSQADVSTKIIDLAENIYVHTIEGYIVNPVTGSTVAINMYWNSSNNSCCYFAADNHEIYMKQSNYNSASCYVTLQYTKTTD